MAVDPSQLSGFNLLKSNVPAPLQPQQPQMPQSPQTPNQLYGPPPQAPDGLTRNHAHQTINLLLIQISTILRDQAMPLYQKIDFTQKVAQTIQTIAPLIEEQQAGLAPEQQMEIERQKLAMEEYKMERKLEFEQYKLQIEAQIKQQKAEMDLQLQQQKGQIQREQADQQAAHAEESHQQALQQNEDNHAMGIAQSTQALEHQEDNQEMSRETHQKELQAPQGEDKQG